MASETPKDECVCSKDADGRCAPCSVRLSEAIVQYFESVIRAGKMIRSLCYPCRKSNADWAGAKAIRELVAAHPKTVEISGVTAFVNNFVATSGITKTPLMDAEIRRLSERKSKEGEGEDPSPKT